MSNIIWASLAITVMLLNACVAPETPQVPPVNDAAAPTAATASQPAGVALLPPETPPSGAEREFSTDFSRHTVSYSEVFSGGPPKDGIPAIDAPKFVTVAQADEWLGPQEPVVLVQVGDDARAYPLQILTWHEIVNDTVGGLPLQEVAVRMGTNGAYGGSDAARRDRLRRVLRATRPLRRAAPGRQERSRGHAAGAGPPGPLRQLSGGVRAAAGGVAGGGVSQRIGNSE